MVSCLTSTSLRSASAVGGIFGERSYPFKLPAIIRSPKAVVPKISRLFNSNPYPTLTLHPNYTGIVE